MKIGDLVKVISIKFNPQFYHSLDDHKVFDISNNMIYSCVGKVVDIYQLLDYEDNVIFVYFSNIDKIYSFSDNELEIYNENS